MRMGNDGEVKRRIETLFYEQCKLGGQTSFLKLDGVVACGQFIGDEARKKEQWGLHGLAAAISVLSKCEDEGRSGLVPGLVACWKRIKETKPDEKKRERNLNNIIKLSEILTALSGVPDGVCQTQQEREALAERINSSRVDNGWRCFIGESGDSPEVLPTAFAYYALYVSGYGKDLRAPRKFLFDSISPKSRSAKSVGTELAIQALVINFLSRTKCTDREREVLRKCLLRLRVSFEHWMERDVEQNIEYWMGDVRSYYVRVPWQLYYIEAGARLAPRRVLGSIEVQGCLKRIDTKILNGGFTYPHSGRFLSARTHQIIYELYSAIKEIDVQKWQLMPASAYSMAQWAIRYLMSYWLVAAIVIVSSIGIMLFSLFLYFDVISYEEGGLLERVAGVGPNVVILILTTILATTRRN